MKRRDVLRAAAGAPWLLSAKSAFGTAANERLNLAIVGVAGYAAATSFVPGLHQLANVGITALCDVNEAKLAGVYKVWEEKAATSDVYVRLLKDKPAFYPDYRRMLEEKGKDIDAVVVATPDHTHAVIAAAALRAGKHVLAEKPLTINVRESRGLRELAIQARRATTMNNQGTSSPRFRRGVELVREGAIGDVSDVHLWFSRGGQNHRESPKGEVAVPDGLHWDLWLGPVAARPYHPKWIARNHWRDTGAGELGNFGPHTMNLPFMALNVREIWTSTSPPIRVSAEMSERNELSFPRWEVMRWRVPARGAMPPVTFHWHHGPVPGLPPGSRERLSELLRSYDVPAERDEAIFKSPGALLVGTKGALLTTSHNTDILLLPEARFKEVDQQRPRTLPLSKGHAQDWIHACRGGAAPLSSFEHAATFGEFLMLGPIATRLGREFAYDPVAGKTDSPEADRLLGYDYRAGFAHS